MTLRNPQELVNDLCPSRDDPMLTAGFAPLPKAGSEFVYTPSGRLKLNEQQWPTQLWDELVECEAVTDESREEIVEFFRKMWKIELRRCFSLSDLLTLVIRHCGYLDEVPYPTRSGRRTRGKGFESYFAGNLEYRRLSMGCYRQGYQGAYIYGLYSGHVVHGDIASCYPASALLQPMPVQGTEILSVTKDNWMDLEGVLLAEFEFPTDWRYTDLWVPTPESARGRGEWVAPTRGTGLFPICDLRTAAEHGCQITPLHGLGFHAFEREKNHPLIMINRELLHLKEQELDKGPLRNVVKQLLVRATGILGGSERAGKLYWPEAAVQIYGRSRALMRDLVVAGQSFHSNIDSLTIMAANKERVLKTKAVADLRTVGSDLKFDPKEEGDQLLVLRRGTYAILRDGESVRTTHHLDTFPEGFGVVAPILVKTRSPGEHADHCKWVGNRKLHNPRVKFLTSFCYTDPYETAKSYLTAVIRGKALRGHHPNRILQAANVKGRTLKEVAGQHGIPLRSLQAHLAEDRRREKQEHDARGFELLQLGAGIDDVVAITGWSRATAYRRKLELEANRASAGSMPANDQPDLLLDPLLQARAQRFRTRSRSARKKDEPPVGQEGPEGQ